MKDLKYSNEQLDINIGDVVYHKSDNRRLVVISFGLDRKFASRDVYDKYLPDCRFFDNDNVRYNNQVLTFPELSKTPLEY